MKRLVGIANQYSAQTLDIVSDQYSVVVKASNTTLELAEKRPWTADRILIRYTYAWWSFNGWQ